MKNKYGGSPAPAPCPFCNSADTGWTFKFSDLLGPMKFFAFCYSCHARGPEKCSPDEALNGWNASGKSCGKKQV